jgi:DNA polymerase elongation subunit (family B)
MYQSVYYDFETKSYYLRDDKEGWVNLKHQPTLYKRVPKQTKYSLPILTGGWAEPTQKPDYTDPNILEKDISKELVLLRDYYYKHDNVIPSYHNIVFLDIETKMGGALTPDYIREAPMPITSIAIIDKNSKQKICFVVDEKDEMQESVEDNKIVIPCKTEKQLILKFLDKWEEIDPTIVATWNGEYFDIPWMYFRFKQIIGKDVNRLSPIRKLNVFHRKNPETGQFEESKITIGGINHLDYMLLHKKYIMKEEPSYKLGEIGPKYAKLEKIEYEGNLNQLFKNDKHLFIDYNLRDVEILEGLEENLKFIDLTVLIAHICNIPYEQIYFNTVMNEGAILKYLKRNGIVSPNKPTTHNSALKLFKETYAGGYIKEPVPGLYFDVIDLDFTSLYPSIIKSLNLGIETLVGCIKTSNKYAQNLSLEKLKEQDPEEEVTVQRLNKENYQLSEGQIKIKDLIEIIEENKYTVSASGAFFRTDIRSVTAIILEDWFNKREHYRELKKKSGKAKDWGNYKLYDNFQMAFKILQNALYGTYAKSGWRYTDGQLICSAAITNTGQRLTQESITYVNGYLNKETKEQKDYVCISDTDSMYIQVGSLLRRKDEIRKTTEHNDILGNDIRDEKNGENVERILRIASEIQDLSNSYLNELCPKMLNISAGKHYFQLKQEVIAKSIIVTGKRRYAMYIINKEGVSVEELDMKGIELMKSNMNKIFKKFGENLIKEILFGKPKPEIDKSVIEFYKSLAGLEPKYLGKPTGVQKLNSYVKKTAKSGEIFSEFELGAPANTKAAIRYNDLLRFKRLDKKFEGIIEGDKIYIVNLIKNPYHIDTIAFPNSKISPEIEAFIKKFIDIDSIFESILLNKLKSFYDDLGWDFPSLNKNVNKFFSFN